MRIRAPVRAINTRAKPQHAQNARGASTKNHSYNLKYSANSTLSSAFSQRSSLLASSTASASSALFSSHSRRSISFQNESKPSSQLSYFSPFPSNSLSTASKKSPHFGVLQSLRWKRRPNETKHSVILTTDITGLGLAGEKVAVSRGRARNHMIPMKLAVYPTPANLAYFPVIKKPNLKLEEEKRQRRKLESRIKDLVVEFKRQVVGGTPGREELYGPVTVEAIIEKTWKQHKLRVTADQIQLPAPITTLGAHSVQATIEGVNAEITINVNAR